MALHLIRSILLAMLPGIAVFAQSPLPQRLALPDYDSLAPSQLIAGAFYPLGFSESGKFAYAIAPADEACGCYFFEFRIQNLLTDRILYRYDYRGDQGPEKEQYENLEALWAAKSAMFKQEMQRYGIVDTPTAFTPQLTGFKVQIEREEFAETGLSDTKFVRKARFEVQDPERGNKTVAHLRFDNMYVKNLKTIGCFKNPFEERVALLVARMDRGWEGLPRVLDFEVIGVHQTKGFR